MDQAEYPGRHGLDTTNWRFLTGEIAGHGSVWRATLNTTIFATSVVTIVVVLSSTAGYALSRLKFPYRAQILGVVLMLHSFPSVTWSASTTR